MSNLEKALKFTLKWEGGYVKDPSDAGGETKFGISDRRDGKIDGLIDLDGDGSGDVPVKMITLEEAIGIYNKEYWEPCGCQVLDLPLAVCVFDMAVNSGVKGALEFLQQTKDPVVYNQMRRDRYYRLVAKNPSQKKYLKGWLNRVNDLRKYVEILQQT